MRIGNVAFLILILPLFTGCASIATSIMQSAADSIECHHKCPGGSPKAEEECRKKCKTELSAKREQSRRDEATKKHVEALSKHQRGILE